MLDVSAQRSVRLSRDIRLAVIELVVPKSICLPGPAARFEAGLRYAESAGQKVLA